MRTFKLLAAFAFIFVCSGNILASRGELPDKVFYEGASYPLRAGFPMEQYFAEHPETNRPKPVNTITTPTGFYATFEFIGNDLYLKDYQMIVGFGTIGESMMPKLFPNGEKLKISWLSKPVIFGLGTGVQNERKTALIFQSYLVLDLKNGEIQSKREINHEEYQRYLKEQSSNLPASTVSYTNSAPGQQMRDNKVMVLLKNGDRLSGMFISGDTKTIKMNYNTVELSFKLSEVRSLTFGTNVFGVSNGVQGVSFGFTERLTNSGILNGRAINLVKPAYPPAARAVNAGGTVNVQVIIDEEGKVVAANAISGDPLFKQVSEQAARESTFNPTVINNQKVKISGVIFYTFAANTPPPPPQQMSGSEPTSTPKFFTIRNPKRGEIPKNNVPFIADLKLSRTVSAAGNAEINQQEKLELFVSENMMLINVTTDASDPEDDVLTYEYEVSGGKIIGKGTKVVWDLTGLKAGIYTIKVAVDDGCGICGNTITKTVTIKE